MSTSLHFDTAFWSPRNPHDALPDFQTGLQALHSKLNQSKVENDEIIAFVKERIAVEEAYASRLSDQAKTALRSTGFNRDEGAGLKSCFENMRTASERFGQQHKQIAAAMTDKVLKPLQKFQDEYKRNILMSKQSVDAALKQFDGLVKTTEKASSTYQKKCRELAELEASEQQRQKEEVPVSPPKPKQKEEEKAANDETVILGHQPISQIELDALVRRMRSEIPIGDYRVPILGRYANTSTGEDISVWLQQNLPQCKDSPAMADVIAQQLIHPLGVLRLVGQRGNKFSPSAQSFYQWRQREDDNMSGSVTNSSSTLGGLWERIGGTQGAMPEENLKRAQREAASADEAYRSAVKRTDQMRMVVEQALFAHFAEMEQIELRRLGTIKQLFADFVSCISDTMPAEKAIVEEMLVYQESLKPETDIQYIVQQYCVGGYTPTPILYVNYNNGIARDQIFGVPLEELAQKSENNVPRFINCILEAIDKDSKEMSKEDKAKLWSTKLPLSKVHATRTDLNIPNDQITVELLQQQGPVMLVALLRLYLLELPECLMTFEFYDAAQALYSNSGQDDSLRLSSLSNLIATLPAAHFATLNALASCIVKSIEQLEDKDQVIHAISQSLGPAILRPRVDSLTTLTSRVPSQFVQDVLKHYDNLFTESTLKSHAESEKRRHARPLVAHKSDYALADPNRKQQQQQQPQAQRWGLKSFMRTGDEGNSNKWGVMGVFQRSATASISSSSSIASSERRASSSSFTRSATMPLSASSITHGSPSPSHSADKGEKPAEVVFDLADHIQRTNASDEKPGADDDTLDPFFDDDE